VTIWNRICGSRLPVVSKVTDQRRKAFAARFKDSLGADLANWEAVCRAIVADNFLTGGGERGWCATFDWIIRPGKITNILESLSRPQARPANPRPTGQAAGGGAAQRHASVLHDNLDFLARVAGRKLPQRFTEADDQFAGPTIDGYIGYAN